MHGPTTQLTATCVSDAVKTVAARSIWEGHVCAFVPVLVGLCRVREARLGCQGEPPSGFRF